MGGRLESGRSGTVRGKARRGNPRLSSPPTKRNLHRSRPATPKPLQSLDVKVKAESLAEYMMFGTGTDIERIIRGAAKELGFQFDAEQYVVQLPENGSYTRIDFVTFHPLRAVYPQGKVHYLRMDAEQQDFIQDLSLRRMGWMVFRPSYRRIYADPLGVMRDIILGIEIFTSQDNG